VSGPCAEAGETPALPARIFLIRVAELDKVCDSNRLSDIPTLREEKRPGRLCLSWRSVHLGNGKISGIPQKVGLYDPQFEHDSCGVGFVAHIKGQKSHGIVENALTMLAHMEHRGAC